MESSGAFAGVHSATDTENGWAFYSEVTGQYYNGHTIAGTQGQIQFETSALDFPAVKGLPNPWSRAEEWYNFNSYQQWSVKPGFKVLGRKAADQQPITWVREYNNFRSFYTAIGHEAAVFKDASVKKHVTGGIMWAVRRDKLIK
jgi:type 1 glutamine amidotransferase